ncbi:MAG: hypothetical protein EBX52_08640, partial [Proteobacteria bacterium]|nr:hypothetical protein [Pseudomonadota bacterium]
MSALRDGKPRRPGGSVAFEADFKSFHRVIQEHHSGGCIDRHLRTRVMAAAFFTEKIAVGDLDELRRRNEMR